MNPEECGTRSLKGAVGVFTCLLLLACGPEMSVGEEPTEMQFSQEEWQPLQQGEQPLTEAPLSPEELAGASWYVSPRGSDGGKGTLQSPLRTIGRAVELARPGDVIRVLPGVYSEELILESQGAAAAPITLRGEGSPRPTLVPRQRAASAVIRVRGRWKLENLLVHVSGAPMAAILFESGASQSSLTQSELRSGTSGAGVLVLGARDITIQNNHIHHFIKPGDDSHGVAVVGPSRNIVIRGNDIHHNSGDSIQCQAGNGPAEFVHIESNRLHDEGENGVDIKRCHHVTVRGNHLFGFPNTAIRPAGTSAGEAVVLHDAARNIVIQGNSISRAGRGVSVLGGSTAPEEVRVEGNAIRDIRNIPVWNGQGIRIAGGRNVRVVGNTLENTASYALMLAADGMVVTGLTVSNNTVRAGLQPLLLRLGRERYRPGMLLDENLYAHGGILKADGVQEKLAGTYARFRREFSGEQITLSSPAKIEVWRQVLRVDPRSGLLK